MGMLARVHAIFAKRQTAPARDEGIRAVPWPVRADAGVYVTEDVALGITTVWACATLIARSIGMLPWQVLAPRGGELDGNERLPDHPVEWLLHREANPEMTAMAWREATLMSALLHGNALSEIERDSVGRPVALWPIEWCRVRVERDQAGNRRYCIDNGAASRVELPARDVLHVYGPSLDGVVGVSVLTHHRHTMGLAVAQERFASGFIANQASPSGIVKVKSAIKADGMSRLRHELEKLYKGPRAAGRIAVLDEGLDWQQVGVSPQDAEFLAQRRFGVEEVCRIFGVPPQKIADTSKSTFANFESASAAFWVDGLMPWCVRLEQEANRKLFRRALAGRGTPFAKINAAAILRADMEKQNAAFARGRQWGWWSVNDVRRMLDQDPIGPEGDIYLQPSNMTAAGDAAAPDAANPAPDPAPAALLRLPRRSK